MAFIITFTIEHYKLNPHNNNNGKTTRVRQSGHHHSPRPLLDLLRRNFPHHQQDQKPLKNNQMAQALKQNPSQGWHLSHQRNHLQSSHAPQNCCILDGDLCGNQGVRY